MISVEKLSDSKAKKITIDHFSLLIIVRKFSRSSYLSSIEEGCTGSKHYISQSYFCKLLK
jgi:hypothetical protein